uniref:Uncharacterized protein n=1 Tax=Candidatus Kentrum sp. SD TaxID=2126332 RepID=A0A451BKF2_9GAMM|nr:MAG: hypothetical protein BECKSD772D_GA0070982_102521 [Candidatus Kentron sp. SD]
MAVELPSVKDIARLEPQNRSLGGIRVDGLESRIDALESGIDAKIGPLEARMTDKMWNPWVSASPLARLRLRPMNHNPALVKDR